MASSRTTHRPLQLARSGDLFLIYVNFFAINHLINDFRHRNQIYNKKYKNKNYIVLETIHIKQKYSDFLTIME